MINGNTPLDDRQDESAEQWAQVVDAVIQHSDDIWVFAALNSQRIQHILQAMDEVTSDEDSTKLAGKIKAAEAAYTNAQTLFMRSTKRMKELSEQLYRLKQKSNLWQMLHSAEVKGVENSTFSMARTVFQQEDNCRKLNQSLSQLQDAMTKLQSRESERLCLLQQQDYENFRLNLVSLVRQNPQAAFSMLKDRYSPGMTVQYGRYPQDSNGHLKPITWRVLSFADGIIQLLCEYCIDMAVLTDFQTWEKSDIRRWLNCEFMNKALTTQEQEDLITATIHTPSNNGHDGGIDTQDKIWLLSCEEVEQYFANPEERCALPTDYAKKHGAGDPLKEALHGYAYQPWWLRSPSPLTSSHASRVLSDGNMTPNDPKCILVNISGVRPVCRLNLVHILTHSSLLPD